jgi:alkaline phosphatase
MNSSPKKNRAKSSGGEADKCAGKNGFSRFPFKGLDNSQRLLLREGVVDSIKPSLCGNEGNKNVILVVGDGMGWEMVRSGAIAKQVVDELEGLGCDTTTGCPDNSAAMNAFRGRTLDDYYTEGKGSGMSFQELDGYALMTTTTTVTQEPNPGNHYAPSRSLLEGDVSEHESGQAALALDECGFPIDFSPLDFEADGGNMVLWDNKMGGEFPWDKRYYQERPDTSTGFDPEYIMRHATDSASTAGTMATGHKAAVNMMSQTLYEEDVSTLVEDAMYCGMAGGVVTSVPMLHATPGAFVTHTNSRSDRDSLRRSFMQVRPTMASGVCGGRYYPFEEDLESMMNGALSSEWTFLYQNNMTTADAFYDPIADLDPDNGDHLLVCLGGDYTTSGQQNLPYRGVDGTYSNRWCSSGEGQTDPDTGAVIGITATTPDELCNHYEQEEIEQIPHISENVKAALDFLGKDDDGFFLMYEQGDVRCVPVYPPLAFSRNLTCFHFVSLRLIGPLTPTTWTT